MPQEIIEAKPTKKLFIETLTQDISVKACILDLIDNSVDSYVRYKIQERRTVNLKISNEQFYLFDDCGGIDKQYLKENVFRFGNILTEFKDATLGMYGIGLKRSIFKLGRQISITTDDGKNYSRIEINVPKWQSKDDDWSIPFETDASKLGNTKPYTEIVITELNDEVKEKLNLVEFQNDLSETIKRVYCLVMKENLDFGFNNNTLTPYPLLVPQPNESYSPSITVEKYDDINIEIICFIDPSKGKRLTNAINQRGWNLFANRRLILANDISDITGWRGGESVKDKSMLPKYHSIYNEFRGLVFLSSNNPFKLPLNTSKTSFNIEDKNYNYILNKMVLTARPIIDFLTSKYSEEKLKEDEIESEIAEKDAEDNILNMQEIELLEIKPSEFKAPQKTATVKTRTTVRISYVKDKQLVDRAMDYFNASTAKEVGERTFDYFIKIEGLND